MEHLRSFGLWLWGLGPGPGAALALALDPFDLRRHLQLLDQMATNTTALHTAFEAAARVRTCVRYCGWYS